MSEKKFAVLIDADNTSHQYLKVVFDEITNEGVVTYKRIYADWSRQAMQTYREPILQYALTPVQQYSYTVGKNATDSAMIIDAMDILHEKNVDGFCLVSSDSDFTKLATRLREGGMTVIGMGRKQTPQAFVAACTSFKYLDLITAEQIEEADEKPASPTKTGKARAKKKEAPSEEAPKFETAVSAEEPVKEEDLFLKTKRTIEKILDEFSDEDGWLIASQIGATVQKKLPEFDCRIFKCKKMTELLDKMGFEIKRITDPNNVENPSGVLVYVRKSK